MIISNIIITIIIIIIVRAGPVFRLGSCYVKDRPSWQNLNDIQRLSLLLSGHNVFLSIEVFSLSCLALYFLYNKFYN